MMNPKNICVIGAGNAGSALAGDLALAGHRCRLFEFPEYADNIDPIHNQGGIQVTGVGQTGFARLEMATTQISEAVQSADIIMVATVALAHERVARELASVLEEGQIVILWTGSGGTLTFRKVWADLGFDRSVYLAESATLPYSCRRLQGPGTVNINLVHGPNILLAALPATDTQAVLNALEGTYAAVTKPAVSILEPALYNPNILFHPVGTLLNMGRIEYSRGEFYLYKEGYTPSVWKVLRAMDAERSRLFETLGYTPYTFDEIFRDCFPLTIEEFCATASKGPFSMQDRYLTEDIPIGVTLTISLARKAGVATPTYDTMIHLASLVNDTDFYSSGRNLARLGLDHLTIDQLDVYLKTGRKP
ncbi:MAG: NAD/NADP octopine/nopaline dehydrogenase family protein [Desulfobacterales bacterium]|nr:MAG: NAD/NADP octopine/nopaline dehydrogenase family protein [Desulfobacterales bacterium]